MSHITVILQTEDIEYTLTHPEISGGGPGDPCGCAGEEEVNCDGESWPDEKKCCSSDHA
jgi:hypothetical protein